MLFRAAVLRWAPQAVTHCTYRTQNIVRGKQRSLGSCWLPNLPAGRAVPSHGEAKKPVPLFLARGSWPPQQVGAKACLCPQRPAPGSKPRPPSGLPFLGLHSPRTASPCSPCGPGTEQARPRAPVRSRRKSGCLLLPGGGPPLPAPRPLSLAEAPGIPSGW